MNEMHFHFVGSDMTFRRIKESEWESERSEVNVAPEEHNHIVIVTHEIDFEWFDWMYVRCVCIYMHTFEIFHLYKLIVTSHYRFQANTFEPRHLRFIRLYANQDWKLSLYHLLYNDCCCCCCWCLSNEITIFRLLIVVSMCTLHTHLHKQIENVCMWIVKFIPEKLMKHSIPRKQNEKQKKLFTYTLTNIQTQFGREKITVSRMRHQPTH